jgi:predicted RNA-binding protein with RPS1 domain
LTAFPVSRKKMGVEILPELLDLILSKGWIALLIVILLLLVQDPDRAEKLRALLLLPLFRLFKIGSRQYVASKVAHSVTTFLRKELLAFLPSTKNVKVEVKWVKSATDPVLAEDGTIVLCMREENDQTRNILAATQVALPRVVCPTIRPYVHDDIRKAMDLALLQKLASALGRHAKPVFQKHFLASPLRENADLGALYQNLLELDTHGTFVTIFLEELDVLGEQLYSEGNVSDHTDAVRGFLDFLLTETRRKLGEQIKLQYVDGSFSVAIILLASTLKADSEGLHPYVNRVDKILQQGFDSIFIIAYERAQGFLDKLLRVIDSDNRLDVAKVTTPRVHSTVSQQWEDWRIAHLRRSPLFSDTDFADRVNAAGLEVGSEVPGEVLDVSRTQAFVDVHGLNAVIDRVQCGWQRVGDCREVLSLGDTAQFLVTGIAPRKGVLTLSLRLPATDPFATWAPSVGDSVEVSVESHEGATYYCVTPEGVEVSLPEMEVSWGVPDSSIDEDLMGRTLTMVITEKQDVPRLVEGSLRRLQENPWPQIAEELPKGMVLQGSISEVTPNFVRVKLPNGLDGIVMAANARKAQRDDLLTLTAVGDEVEVTISKVMTEHEWIRLDLPKEKVKIPAEPRTEC